VAIVMFIDGVRVSRLKKAGGADLEKGNKQ
jgi:hypothetical protein